MTETKHTKIAPADIINIIFNADVITAVQQYNNVIAAACDEYNANPSQELFNEIRKLIDLQSNELDKMFAGDGND